ncbi:MAG: DUF6320 domain-containing protein [bacterium]|nr:DUF6320 domain-containing protein [bacterium]
MSYCVNCGVELDASHKTCPLCNTPVINPRELHAHCTVPPFPQEKGQVELVKRKDAALLLSVVLLSTAVTCGLLNFFVYKASLWSLSIIGACGVFWVFMIPLVIYTKLSAYAALLLDGASACVYLFMLTWLTKQNGWFFGIALPIVLLVTALAESMTFLLRRFHFAFLVTATVSIIEIAVLCVGIELILNRYLHQRFFLSWSGIVLTICTIITIALVTILSKKRLRNAVRRRLHF